MTIEIFGVGDKGPEIGNWQRFLSDEGYTDSAGNSLVADESFGPKTDWATKNFQVGENLVMSGKVDLPTRKRAQEMGFIPFIQAKNCNVLWPASRGRIDLVVLHTMESPEKPTTAFDVAMWFAGQSAPQASAHYCIDSAETIQTVRDGDVAWHAPGANRQGIGIEHAGYAAQTEADWSDEYSVALLERSAQLTARLCKRYGVPVRRLSVSDLKAGARGICGHVDVTNAWNNGHGHQDPGPNFPYDSYLARVTTLLSSL